MYIFTYLVFVTYTVIGYAVIGYRCSSIDVGYIIQFPITLTPTVEAMIQTFLAVVAEEGGLIIGNSTFTIDNESLTFTGTYFFLLKLALLTK